MTYYTPAQAARRTGLSLDTLRYYEKSGVIAPVARTGAGRRVYSEQDLDRLELVRCLRQTGMPVAELRRYGALGTGEEAAAERLRLLEEHDARLLRAVELMLAARRDLLLGKIDRYRSELGLPPYPDGADGADRSGRDDTPRC
ncbi:MerR family transcriptional regulator [Streptomyces spiramenti]|uniref:MerR family transcriptional regulator n=1 Tax=Streptomyces spiramenti TaxID=2720606 RepID=A0ABX1AEH1_9ACTN|nr:MerR family transcriptional regulator [Streptomyces spiramenti]NJP65617.1 MerR family transcriptional regulator [Streptomyces spiramenti]